MKMLSRLLSTALSFTLLLGIPQCQGWAGATQTKLPVLAIETKRRDAGAKDFVTEPVAPLVAERMYLPEFMPPAPYYEACTVTLKSGKGEQLLKPCDAQVKVRGNWTTNYPKKSLRIKFDKKQKLLGLNDGAKQKNWVLLAEYKDISMLRDKAALSLSREILGADGLYAADAELVSVTINGEYWGVYLLADMQQVSAHRVRITEPDQGYTGTDIGYFLEYDAYYTYEEELQSFSPDFAGNAALRVYDGNPDTAVTCSPLPVSEDDPTRPIGITIKSDIYSQAQHDFIENFINQTYRILYEAAYHQKAFVFDDAYREISETDALTPRQAVERVVDVQSLADMYIISELTCDADLYFSSFFMDVDFGPDGDRKLRFEAPWDFDSAMGNKDRCLDGTGFYACNLIPDVNASPVREETYYTVNPWLVVLAYEDWYQDLIRETWARIRESGVLERTVAMIGEDSAALQREFKRNYKKWDNIRWNHLFVKELSEPAKNCRNEAEAAVFLQQWLTSRIEFLDSRWSS